MLTRHPVSEQAVLLLRPVAMFIGAPTRNETFILRLLPLAQTVYQFFVARAVNTTASSRWVD